MYKNPNVDFFHHDELIKNAEYYEYASSVNPLAAGLITNVAVGVFPHTLHEEGDTRIIPLDLSDKMKCNYPATSPALLANFIRIRSNEMISTSPNATSEVYYVIRGQGHTEIGNKAIPWNTGDYFVLPANFEATHHAETSTAFYWVHDEPLLSYLGVKSDKPKFEPTLYVAETAAEKLYEVEHIPGASSKSRVSVLLANKAFPQTRTITHVLWAMFGVLPANQVQQPHRHQSAAVDFAVECQDGVYTLMGAKLDEKGEIIDPLRVDWKPGSAFVTPPGWWHSHHNASGVQAHVLPLQDAGLHTYLRALDIQFAGSNQEIFIQ